MLTSFFQAIRGIISIALYIIAMIVIASTIIISAFFVWIVPLKWWRYYGFKMIQVLPIWWTDLNRAIMQISTRGKWDVQGSGDLHKKGWYIVISNHQSWVDILVLSSALHRKVPILKFFMKKQLLWSLPFAGLASYVLGYPFMNRHTASEIRKNPSLKGKDIETTKKACKKFEEYPTSVINFVEGTRFSEAKKTGMGSPYQHLLKPKAAGAAIVINEMRSTLHGIVNTTLIYDKRNLSFWDFAKGNFEKVCVRYELLPMEDVMFGDYYTDRDFRKRFQAWLNGVWEEKDALLTELIAGMGKS